MYVYIAPTASEFLHQRGVCVLCVHGMTSLLQTTVKYIAVTYNSFWLCLHTYVVWMLCGEWSLVLFHGLCVHSIVCVILLCTYLLPTAVCGANHVAISLIVLWCHYDVIRMLFIRMSLHSDATYHYVVMSYLLLLCCGTHSTQQSHNVGDVVSELL